MMPRGSKMSTAARPPLTSTRRLSLPLRLELKILGDESTALHADLVLV